MIPSRCWWLIAPFVPCSSGDSLVLTRRSLGISVRCSKIMPSMRYYIVGFVLVTRLMGYVRHQVSSANRLRGSGALFCRRRAAICREAWHQRRWNGDPRWRWGANCRLLSACWLCKSIRFERQISDSYVGCDRTCIYRSVAVPTCSVNSELFNHLDPEDTASGRRLPVSLRLGKVCLWQFRVTL